MTTLADREAARDACYPPGSEALGPLFSVRMYVATGEGDPAHLTPRVAEAIAKARADERSLIARLARRWSRNGTPPSIHGDDVFAAFADAVEGGAHHEVDGSSDRPSGNGGE